MARVEVGFVPNAFERQMVQQTKEDIDAKLRGYDLEEVQIILKKLPGGQLAFKFEGEPYDVDKAKGLLGIE
jgi:hypothetical protein